jgi:hypothetical protein
MQVKNKYTLLLTVLFSTIIFTSCSKKGLSISGSKKIETIAQLPVQDHMGVPNKVSVYTTRPEVITKTSVNINGNKHEIGSIVSYNRKRLISGQKRHLGNQSVEQSNIPASNTNTVILGHKVSSPVRLTQDTKETMGISSKCCMFVVVLAALAACLAVFVKIIKLSWFPITTLNSYILAALILILLLVAIVKLFELLV